MAITGAARGIGRATARALRREGMKVAIGDLDSALAQKTAAELGAQDAAVGLPLDVTDRASFTAFLDQAEQSLGPIDVLINNAGIMPLGPFAQEDDTMTRRIIDINVHGVILGTKLALQRMVPRDSGHIVNIASQAGKVGTPGGATYSASKHAVIGLSESVRGELALTGSAVAISYVMPSVVDTELGSGLPELRGVGKLTPEAVAEAIVQALKNGTIDVWVPASVKRLNGVMNLLPRSTRERIGHAIKADRVLFEPDRQVRAQYELRAAHSEPALDAAEEQRQIAAGSDAEK